MRRRNNNLSLPPSGEGGRGPARGRMRGECADIAPQKGNKASSPLISPLTRTASPEGEALETQKRGRFCVLFFTYTHISGVPTQ